MLIKYAFKDCIAKTAFAHEVMHVIRVVHGESIDHGHDVEGLWGGNRPVSVENIIRKRSCARLCSLDACAYLYE